MYRFVDTGCCHRRRQPEAVEAAGFNALDLLFTFFVFITKVLTKFDFIRHMIYAGVCFFFKLFPKTVSKLLHLKLSHQLKAVVQIFRSGFY